MTRWIKLLPLRKLFRHGRFCCKALILFSTLSLLITLIYLATAVQHPSEEFLETNTCPACYGELQCKDFRHITFKGKDLLFVNYPVLNLKNVFFGQYGYKSQIKIVLKKLAHNAELKKVDENICKMAKSADKNCDLKKAIMTVVQSDDMVTLLKGVSFMTECPTQRLVDRISSKYGTSGKIGMGMYDNMHLLTTLMVNSEPIILQMFPKSEGWPFPEYYGACGRVIGEEYGGNLLSHYYDAPWETRVSIAWNIMEIADDLTNKDQDFALYWTDLSYENLSVREDGSVMIIDAEHILVVDKTEIRNTKPNKWDIPLESEFDECSGNCLSIHTSDLCTRVDCDHNYYAACRNLLSPAASDGSYVGGFLHDIPSYVSDSKKLEQLLNECAKPETGSRMKAVKDLMKLLLHLQSKKGVNA